MTSRRAKKRNKLFSDWNEFLKWLTDYRGYLLEADQENADLRIIDQQFKRRLVGRNNCAFKATRMHKYRKNALDITTFHD